VTNWRGVSHGLDSAFHATADKQYVRDGVFGVLAHLDYRFDVTVLEKRKAQPQLRSDEETLFKYAWFYHLRQPCVTNVQPADDEVIIVAELGTKKKRKAFRGAIGDVMTQCLHYRVKRALAFWRDESDFALQAVDYLTWAVTRHYERGDSRSYELIAHKVTRRTTCSVQERSTTRPGRRTGMPTPPTCSNRRNYPALDGIQRLDGRTARRSPPH
jgi:hypothetical protein